MPSKYETKVQNLTDHFSSLVAFVEKIAFSDHRDGILTPQDMSNWSKVRQWIHQITHTTLSIDNQSLWKILVYLIWAYSAAVSLATGVIFIQPDLYQLLFTTIQPSTLANDTLVIIFTSLLAALLVPVAIYWWYEVITESRYSITLKIALAVFFFYLLYEFGRKLQFDNVTLQSWLDLRTGLLRAFGLHFAPSITYFMAIGLDSLLSLYYLLKVVFGGTKSIHNPLPLVEIKKLLLEDIPGTNNKESWRMSTLTMPEIKALSDWSKTNRDATEKRTMPISIGLGLVGLATVSSFIQSKTDNLIASWLEALVTFYQDPFSIPLYTSVLNLGIFFIVIAFMLLVVMTLVRLFVNLAVQNIIIEACTLVQYGKSRSYNAHPKVSAKK